MGIGSALLARVLTHCDEVALDGMTARTCGRLYARTGTSDVSDASVVVAAAHASFGDRTVVATSDSDDIAALTTVLNADVRILRV